MKKLILDTSNKYLFVAVYEDSEEIFKHLQEGNNNHSETLVSVLERLLQVHNIKIDDIKEIYVGRGPGSYTGVRVSCTVAKVLAYLKNIKLFSFSSLDLLLTTNFEKDIIVVAMNARRGFSYAKVFDNTNGLKILLDEVFIETEKLNNDFPNALYIDDSSSNYDLDLLFKYNLFKEEENVHAFTPTYLRSGV